MYWTSYIVTPPLAAEDHPIPSNPTHDIVTSSASFQTAFPSRSELWAVHAHIKHTHASHHYSISNHRLGDLRTEVPLCPPIRVQPAVTYMYGCAGLWHRQAGGGGLEPHSAEVGVGLPHCPHDGQEDGPLHTIRKACILHNFPVCMSSCILRLQQVFMTSNAIILNYVLHVRAYPTRLRSTAVSPRSRILL